jgi:hypothetical protein
MVLLSFSSPRLVAAAFEWCWRAVALVTTLVLSLALAFQTAHSRSCRAVRERTDIASDPAHRAGGGVVLKASLASSFGRQVVPEISTCANRASRSHCS